MPIRFRFGWIPFCATVLVTAAGVALGQWQTHRAQQKLEIQARMDERETAPPLTSLPASADEAGKDGSAGFNSLEFRHVQLSGEYLPGWASYLENRPYKGVPGFYVVMPFKIAGSDQVVLVMRGWSPRDPTDRAKVPQVPTPAGTTQIVGELRQDAGHVLQLGQADAPRPGAILQNLDVAAYAQASGLPLAPFVIEQGGKDVGDALVRDWPAPSLGIDRHRGYALQWYALAAMALVFFVVTGFRRGRKPGRN
ncbi:SURF1 family protein [Herbaspirillum lusitanum]|uniref:SURF1-like protein n=1 Tax=Herbaspirillum lusitanum TaxID=213312 RepID=A0ABW9ADZ6_9BURK